MFPYLPGVADSASVGEYFKVDPLCLLMSASQCCHPRKGVMSHQRVRVIITKDSAPVSRSRSLALIGALIADPYVIES